MADNLKFWSGYLIIVGVVLAIGWNQPLRYRFMTGDEIYAAEHPPTPPPILTREQQAQQDRGQWMWSPDRKTSLDRNRRSTRQTQ